MINDPDCECKECEEMAEEMADWLMELADQHDKELAFKDRVISILAGIHYRMDTKLGRQRAIEDIMWATTEATEELSMADQKYIDKLKERWCKLLNAEHAPKVYNENHAVQIFQQVQDVYDCMDDQIYKHQGENNIFNPIFFLIPALRTLLQHDITFEFDPDWVSENPETWNSDAPDMFGININSEMVNVLSYDIILEPLRENDKLEAYRSADDFTLTDIFNKEVDGAIIKMGLLTVDKKGIVTWHVERIK